MRTASGPERVFFIHPSVKQNVPEWRRLIKSQICFGYSFLRWGLKSFSSSVPVSPFLFHWKLVLKLNVAFSYLVSVVDTRFMRAIQSSMRNSHQYLAFIQFKNKNHYNVIHKFVFGFDMRFLYKHYSVREIDKQNLKSFSVARWRQSRALYHESVLLYSHLSKQWCMKQKRHFLSSVLSIKASQSSTIYRLAATWQNQQYECAPSEDSDQPGHPPSLIRVFAVRSVGS